MKRPSQKPPLSIVMWHGGRRWDGPPAIVPSKKGQAERGPGIYCTNSYRTAYKYAKGGGQVRKLVIEPKGLLEHIAIPLPDALHFVKAHLIRRTHDDIVERLHACSERLISSLYTTAGEGPHVPLSVLNNLCVNSDQAHGSRGAALNRFLVEWGADASFDYAAGNEVWGVVFNPECIVRQQAVPAAQVTAEQFDLPDAVRLIRDHFAAGPEREPGTTSILEDSDTYPTPWRHQ